MNEWNDGWMEKRIDGWMMNEKMDEWLYGWIDELMDGSMDG